MPCVYYHHGPQVGLGRLCSLLNLSIVLFFYSLSIIRIYANVTITVVPCPPRLIEGGDLNRAIIYIQEQSLSSSQYYT